MLNVSFRYLLGTLSLIAALALVACNGAGEELPTPAPPTTATPTPMAGATPQATPDDATPEATPRATPVATPDATPEATPVAEVSLQAAYANLLEQESFVMTINLTGVQAQLQLLTAMQDSLTIVVRQEGDNRHVQIMDGTGAATLAEAWYVDGTYYVDAGAGPVETSGTDPMIQQLEPIIFADRELIAVLGGPGATYDVTGREEVNGVDTTVAESSYEVQNLGRAAFFMADRATVDSTIWVAEDGHYLTRAELRLQPENGAADREMSVRIDVTEVGEAEPVEAPTGR